MKIRRVRTGEVPTLARRVRAAMLRRLSARTVLQITCQGERRIGQQSRATPWRHLGTNLSRAGLPVMLLPKLSQAATQSDVDRVKTRLQFQHWFAARRREVFRIDNVTGSSLVSGIEGQRAASRGAPPGDAPKPGHRCAERGTGESSADASTMFRRLGFEERDALPSWSRGACMPCLRTADLACHGRNKPGRSPGLTREVHPRPGFSRSSMTFPLHRKPVASIHCFVFPIPLQHAIRSKADPGLLQ